MAVQKLKGGKILQYVLMTLLVIFVLLIVWSITVEAERSQLEEWRDYIEIVADDYNICPELIEAVIEQESSWRPDAVNGSCIGLMQINPEYHAERMERLGVEDLLDPYDNILVGTDFLAELFWEYDDIYAVLMYYNAGLAGRGIQRLCCRSGRTVRGAGAGAWEVRIMEAKLREYMDELETGSMWDCKQIYDWMFGAIDFSRRIGLIEKQVENVLKEELERRFENMQKKFREAQV